MHARLQVAHQVLLSRLLRLLRRRHLVPQLPGLLLGLLPLDLGGAGRIRSNLRRGRRLGCCVRRVVGNLLGALPCLDLLGCVGLGDVRAVLRSLQPRGELVKQRVDLPQLQRVLRGKAGERRAELVVGHGVAEILDLLLVAVQRHGVLGGGGAEVEELLGVGVVERHQLA